MIDKFFKNILKLFGFIIIFLGLLIFLSLFSSSLPSIKKFGLKFLFLSDWDPVNEVFGGLPFILGTLITSLLAFIISLPFILSVTIILGVYFTEGFIAEILRHIIDLIAAIPSVIIGFWGLFVFVPIVREVELLLGVTPYGVGIITASILLAFMILPYSASIGKDAMRLVPQDLKEAAFSLGATKWEVIKKIMIPYARSGIIAGMFLSLGRALGETMVVTMVIGNKNSIPQSIFEPGNTIASVIANEFAEAITHLHVSSLIYLGLILFLITMLFNIIAKFMLKKFKI